ncbi:NAD-dependent 15-hydroxyprostaglandin dehydrogenase [Fonsecaea pedrosoi]|nr:NAD-dependent 15-hydroxyprostaglandin dehydrogenase [Fonsecaea pedrosoi]
MAQVQSQSQSQSQAQVQVDLGGKGAIVTGGGSGICLAFVQHLYRAGCNVLICDLGLHREAVAWLDSIGQSGGGTTSPKPGQTPAVASSSSSSSSSASPRVAFLKTDVSDWKQLEQTFEGYAREFGGGLPDVVCPGAGVYEPSFNNFWNDRDDDHYQLLRINLEHPLKMSRIAIRKWVQQRKRGGIIVHVSSTGAQKPSMLTPLYGAAKQGVSNFTRGMARLQDLEGIRVVAVAPGPTMSPLMYDHPEALRFVDPDKDKLSTPDEIARGMMAVAFDRDRFPPGTVLEVTHPDRWREVSLLNDPGPGPHAFTSRKEEGMADVYAALDADRKSVSV